MALFRKKAKSNDVLAEEKQETVEEKVELAEDGTVRTTLVFHPEWEHSPQEKYIYQFQHQQLPKLKPNQISISGFKLEAYDNDLFVTAFLRNTLEKPIKFETIDLLLLDENDQTIARQNFDMEDLGELPAMSCMPWSFLFSEDYIFAEELPQGDNWKIAFELKNGRKQEHSLDLAESWENQLSDEQKNHLEKLVSGLPKLNPGEVNFMGLEAKLNDDPSLAVTVLIRNGSDKNIKLEQIPLIVEDAAGEVVAQGGFRLEDFEVKANTSKPWTFIFPGQLVSKEQPDLSSWKVYPPQQK